VLRALQWGNDGPARRIPSFRTEPYVQKVRLNLSGPLYECAPQLRRPACMEHRGVCRYEVEIPVYAQAYPGVITSVGCLLNVSETGGFLLTTLPVQLHSSVSLHLMNGGEARSMEGQVVRRSFAGLGIEWSKPQAELIRTLDVNSEGYRHSNTCAASGS